MELFLMLINIIYQYTKTNIKQTNKKKKKLKKRKLELYTNGNDSKRKGYVSLYLNSMDGNDGKYINLETRYVLFIRNVSENSCFHGRGINYI